MVRGLLPASLKAKVPAPQEAGAWPLREHARKVLMLAGCVQPAMMPNINTATARVLDAVGIQTVIAPQAGCCGAVKFHLNDQAGGMAEMRANIDAWWPLVDSDGAGGVEAIVMNASGCGVTVKEYGHILQHDPQYADKAARISALTRDLSELLPAMLPELAAKLQGRVNQPGTLYAYHPPCTLQHGQRLGGVVEGLLRRLGVELVPVADPHLCCGSAGTYSLLQPALSRELRANKLLALQAGPYRFLLGNATGSTAEPAREAPCLPGTAVAIMDSPHIPPSQAERVRYSTTPPTSGPHFAFTVATGVYDRPVAEGLTVHAMEHGHVVIQYAPDAAAADVAAGARWVGATE